ncbi:hypothetical protein JDV02_010203 [Purpureocillium takamizusanense]|uniref:Uncharacterized protein n=1 Tax=Purpureocillium takamizusanense TaxID=2060973 RepID=A0A9Q8QRD1_9HYPO|nr:uncharacterized protein JDV02_010203 [Purpureocillium takamizusanense]UNI24460.1 hypothetical protein JDV02_010203 [Purpureocillium takamizusanense]
MGSFGAAVESLVETYNRCLKLLERLHLGSSDGDGACKQRALLNNQARSDRSMVRRAYRSKLSRRGSAFELGDALATSSVKRVARKLKAALSAAINQLGRGKAGRDTLDYASLTAHSTDARKDAIRAMTSLSARLPSLDGDVRSRTGRSTASSINKKSGHHRYAKSASSSRPRTLRRRDQAVRPRPSSGNQREAQLRPPVREEKRQECGKRYSSTTSSSQSTKLGEVRSRRRRGGEQGVRGDYGTGVTYPLPYPWVDDSEAPGYERRGKGRFWGLFGRR